MYDRFCTAFVAALLSLTVALLLLPGSIAQAGMPDCIGLDACEGNTGAVGAGACVGDFACFENTGDIGKNSCQGPVACHLNSGFIDRNACQGDGSCSGNRGDVGKGGCAGDGACDQNEGAVGTAACVGGHACLRHEGTVAKLGCHGDLACRGSSTNVGVDACRGEAACARSTSVAIGKGSCVGTGACIFTGPEPIGKGACRGDRACFENPGPIGDGECVGPPVDGVGVCEKPRSVGIDVNNVTLTGGNIVGIQYIENSLHVTTGQTVGSPPVVTPPDSSGAWTITVVVNRQGSSSIADGFNNATGGADHELPTFNIVAKSPAELNFYFGVNLTIELNETTYTVPIYLGQGHVVFDNNWWMGGFAITAGSLDGPAHLLVGGSSFPVIGRGFSAFIIEF